MNENELIDRLNNEVKAKLNAQEEVERFKKEIQRLQANMNQALHFIETQDKVIDKIIKELRGEENEKNI